MVHREGNQQCLQLPITACCKPCSSIMFYQVEEHWAITVEKQPTTEVEGSIASLTCTQVSPPTPKFRDWISQMVNGLNAWIGLKTHVEISLTNVTHFCFLCQIHWCLQHQYTRYYRRFHGWKIWGNKMIKDSIFSLLRVFMLWDKYVTLLQDTNSSYVYILQK